MAVCLYAYLKNLLLENIYGQTPIELAEDLCHHHIIVKLLQHATTLDAVVPKERQFKFLSSLWYHANSEVIALVAKQYLPKPIYNSFVYNFPRKTVESLGVWIHNPNMRAGLVKFSITSKDWELILYHFIGKKALLFVKNRQHLHHGSYTKPMHAIGLWTWRNFWQSYGSPDNYLFKAIDKAIGQAIDLPSYASLTKKIHEGSEPVIIPSGWTEHSVTVVFIGSLLFICNRGEKYSTQTHELTAYRINNTLITESFVRKIVSFRKSEASIDEAGTFLFDTLPKALDGKVDSFCEQIHTPACQPPPLNKPICVAANLRLALLAILLSHAVKKNESWNFLTPTRVYKDYTLSARYSILHKYLSASHLYFSGE